MFTQHWRANTKNDPIFLTLAVAEPPGCAPPYVLRVSDLICVECKHDDFSSSKPIWCCH